jgi:hypothetical protein
MKPSVFLKSFNSDDFFTVNVQDGVLAGQNRFIIDENGASPAESFSTTVFGPCEFQVRAQNPYQFSFSRYGQADVFSVEFKTYGFFH